jgi:mannosyltransferase
VTLAAAPEREPPPPTPIHADRARRGLRRPEAIALAAILVLAAVLRLEGIGTWYWIDESLSIGLARHNLYEIPSLLLRDGSPPLWYLILHGWMALFGTSIVATHALSFVFAVLTVPAAWYLGRRLFGDRAAWFVAVLVAINPFVTYFARETRMYSLVALLALVVAATFVEAFVDGRQRAAWWFAASLTALLYTHNWGLYTAVACVAALVPIVLTSPDRAALVRRAAVVFGIVGLAYLPWLPALLSQVQNTGAPWSYTPSARGVVAELAALFRDERTLGVLALATIVGLTTFDRNVRSRDTLAGVSLAIIVAGPILIGWTLAHVEPSWATRYLAVIVGPLVLLVGFAISRARGVGVAALVLVAVLVLQPITRVNGLPFPLDAKSNARALAERMVPRLADGDIVFVAQPEAVPLLRAELGDGFVYVDPMGVVEDPTVVDWRDAEARLRASSLEDIAGLFDALEPGQRVLVVRPANPPADTDTAWIELFRLAGQRTGRALHADERFELVASLGGASGSYVTFDGVIWERVTNRGG